MTKTDILQLNLKREFFDCIVRGKKKFEYREYKPYWKSRLEGRDYRFINFRNGYSPHAPEMLVEFLGLGRDGNSRNAAYKIKLGRILKLKRWRKKD
jgi:hypothetical protein